MHLTLETEGLILRQWQDGTRSDYCRGTYYEPEFGVLDKLSLNAKLCYYWEVIL